MPLSFAFYCLKTIGSMSLCSCTAYVKQFVNSAKHGLFFGRSRAWAFSLLLCAQSHFIEQPQPHLENEWNMIYFYFPVSKLNIVKSKMLLHLRCHFLISTRLKENSMDDPRLRNALMHCSFSSLSLYSLLLLIWN